MSVLPQGKLAPTRVNPKIIILYGPPKIGKTTICAQLENSLLLDFEKGADIVEASRVPIGYIDGPTIHADDGTLKSTSLNTVIGEITKIGEAEFKKTGKTPKPPYKYIVIDTADKLEDYCEVKATANYKASVIGKNFEGSSVLELPQGGGYYWLRQCFMDNINILASICEHLIIISHLREKNLSKGGIDVSVKDLSLTGKMGQILCAKADAIGYLYREAFNPKDLMVNFETVDQSSTMGARFPRLAGKRMIFSWETIFIKD